MVVRERRVGERSQQPYRRRAPPTGGGTRLLAHEAVLGEGVEVLAYGDPGQVELVEYPQPS